MFKKIVWIIFIFGFWTPFVLAEGATTDQKTQENVKEQVEDSSETKNETKTTGDKKGEAGTNSKQEGISLTENAKSAVMIEASTGKIIYEKNKDEQLPMASMTKMMTLLLIMEEIEKGNLKWDEMITASEHAASMGGSQIFLEVGEQMSVEDMVKGICIGSGNDVVVIKKQSQVIGEEITI